MADTKLANPGALGLGGFALTTFVLSVVNTGLIDGDNVGMVLPLALFYGGLAQFCAGMWDVKRGDIFGASCFSSYGMFWVAVATMILLEKGGVIADVPREGLGVLFIGWGLFTLYATAASFKVARAVTAVFIPLTVVFFLLAIGEWSSTVHKIAGYGGILVALLAWYCSAAILINNLSGREVLPMGHAAPAA
jgi:succinate-acetate transporter protein